MDIQRTKTGHCPSEKIKKKLIGLMKDQLVGKIMTEFFVRAKMYAYRMTYKKVEEKRCKGTTKCVVEQCLAFDDIRPVCFMVKQYTGSK